MTGRIGVRCRARRTALFASALLVTVPLAGVESSVTAGASPGAVTTYSAPSISGPVGIVTGPDGALWFTENYGEKIGRIQ